MITTRLGRRRNYEADLYDELCGLLLAAAVLLLPACTSDGAGPETGETGKTVAFSAGMAETRALENNSIPTDKKFYVLAYTNGSQQLYMGTQSGTDYTGMEVVCQSGNNVWVPTDEKIYYWPAEPLNFTALYPENLLHNSDYSLTHTVSNNITEQKDILYAYAGNLTAASNNLDDKTFTSADSKSYQSKAVKLDFKHLFSQICFEVSLGQRWTVVLESITICNIYNTGTFNYSSGTWTNSGARDNKVKFTLASPKTLDDTSKPAELLTAADNHTLVLMPQNLNNPWIPMPDKSNPIASADSKKQSYLDIACSITDEATHSNLANGHIYAPISGTWEANKKYTYQIVFGAGYKDTGEASIQLLQLSATITDWAEGTSASGQARFD